MTLLRVDHHPPAHRSAFGFEGLAPAKARPFVLGLLLLALLLIYCSVVQGSVQRGQLLNREMADASSRCDARANPSRAPNCSTRIGAEGVRSQPLQPQPAAGR